jgi:hypothetical protein
MKAEKLFFQKPTFQEDAVRQESCLPFHPDAKKQF